MSEVLPAHVSPAVLAQARLETALLIARVQAKAAIREARSWWTHVGRYAMTMRMLATLDPQLTTEDRVINVCRAVLSERFLLDLSQPEATEVCVATLEGWSHRLWLEGQRP